MEQRFKQDGKTAYRERGQGSIYSVKRSRFLYVKYYDSAGRPRIESTGSSDARKAEKILRARLADAERGLLPGPAIQRTTLGDLIATVSADYRKRKLRTLRDIEIEWRLHLEPFFGERFRASRLTTDAIDKYILHRKDEGASDASIRNELALVRRAYNLGKQSTPPKVTAVPYFRMPGSSNDNARQEFYSAEDIARLETELNKLQQLPLRAMLHCAYYCGWRLGELKTMKCRQFDIATGKMTLPALRSKNKRARVIGTSATTRQLLTACVMGKGPDDLIFSDEYSSADIRWRWENLRVAAGLATFNCRTCGAVTVPNPTKSRASRFCAKCDCTRSRHECKCVGGAFHSFRRTAARDMIDAGVPQHVVMETCGWKTDAMFRRYAIVDAKQTQAGQNALEEMRKRQSEERAKQVESGQFGYTLVAPAPKPDDLRLGTTANKKLEN
jgi:integrase